MDVVVTVPKNFTHPAAPGKRGLAAWIAEGDAAGDPPTGNRWYFTTFGAIPKTLEVGDRVYVVCEGRLRGFAPLLELLCQRESFRNGRGRLAFVRGAGAVAVTIPEAITGFRGWRYRWWDLAIETPFPNWKET